MAPPPPLRRRLCWGPLLLVASAVGLFGGRPAGAARAEKGPEEPVPSADVDADQQQPEPQLRVVSDKEPEKGLLKPKGHDHAAGQGKRRGITWDSSVRAAANFRHGPPVRARFGTLNEALDAGVVLATTEPPSRKQPRGPWVQVSHELRPMGNFYEGEVVAPEWCNPCSSESMEIQVGRDMRFFITTPPDLWSRQSFTVYIEDPASNRPKVVPAVTETIDGMSVLASISVPHRKSGIEYIKVLFPFGVVRDVQVPEHLRSTGGTFEFIYLPEDEKQRQFALRLERENRCCCSSIFGCRWFPNIFLKAKGSCPRVEVNEGKPVCTKEVCGMFHGDTCKKTHHGKGKCKVSDFTDFHFAGGRCVGGTNQGRLTQTLNNLGDNTV